MEGGEIKPHRHVTGVLGVGWGKGTTRTMINRGSYPVARESLSCVCWIEEVEPEAMKAASNTDTLPNYSLSVRVWTEFPQVAVEPE